MTRQPTAITHPVHCDGTCPASLKHLIKQPRDAQDFFLDSGGGCKVPFRSLANYLFDRGALGATEQQQNLCGGSGSSVSSDSSVRALDVSLGNAWSAIRRAAEDPPEHRAVVTSPLFVANLEWNCARMKLGNWNCVCFLLVFE